MAKPAKSAKKHAQRDGSTVVAWARRTGWVVPAAVFVVAFVLRFIYIRQIQGTPFFETLGLDAKFYDAWARQMSTTSAESDAFFMSPLYPYFLAIVHRLLGRDLFLLRVVQGGIGAATAALTCLIGRRVFGNLVGLIAGLVVALYGVLIFYDGSILIAPLLVFLYTLSLYLLLRADDGGAWWLYAAAGVALGGAAIGKATALAFVPVAMLWIWFAWKRGRSGRGRAVALFALGVLLTIAPVTVRNLVVADDLVLLTSNGGLNFYIGNSPTATGGYAEPEGLDISVDLEGKTIAERDLGPGLRPSQVSAYWYGRARDYILANPGEWLRLLTRKIVFALSAYEIPQLENYYFQRLNTPLLRLPLPGYGLVAPLGLLGLGLAFRRRRVRLLALFVAVYLATVVAFFVVARYRLPVVPVLAVGAGFAVVELVRLMRERSWLRFGMTAAVLGGLLLIANVNFYRVDRMKPFAEWYYRLGVIYAERDEPAEAIEAFSRAIEYDPGCAKCYLNVGSVLAKEERLEDAVDAFRSALALAPDYEVARVNLAVALQSLGQYERAVAVLDTLLADDPDDGVALKQKGVSRYRQGRHEEAAELLRAALATDIVGPSRDEAAFYLTLIERPERPVIPQAARAAMAAADSLAPAGRVLRALEELERARELAPDSGEPLRRMALIKRDMGLREEARELMEEALALDPFVEHGHFTLGVILSEMERHEDAIREYESELSIDPAFTPALRNLALTYYFSQGNPNLAIRHYREYLRIGGEPIQAMDELMRRLDSGAAGS